jgi:peptide/nickel transport system ATP-binding protein
MTPILEVRELRKHYGLRHPVRAVDGVSFAVERGETLGLVGESGCGKSTLARTLLLLEAPTSGEILFDGARLTARDAKRLRRSAQMVFQDPYASLPPRMRVQRILADPLAIHGVASSEFPGRVRRLLQEVGLKDDVARKLPHELSGGQRQRVGIARALVGHKKLIIFDEPTSALDAHLERLITDLIAELCRRTTVVVIAHRLSTLRVTNRILVLKSGRLVEDGPWQELSVRPGGVFQHMWTQQMVSDGERLKAVQ